LDKISEFSRPVTSITCIINTAVFRDESDVVLMVKKEVFGETSPFCSFPDDRELVVECSGVM
jgi:hypothetical protein